MRDPDRIDPIIDTLRAIWKQNPDYRLGQLIANGVRAANDSVDPFYIEDNELIEGIKTQVRKA